MTFTPNEPFTTPLPRVVVDAGLPPGQHRFQLVVVGRSGRQSRPMVAVVTVLPRRPIPDPTPMPDPLPPPRPTPRFPP
jgi:hypothetical protein